MSIQMGLVANVTTNEIIAKYPSKIKGDHLRVITEQVIPSFPAFTNQLRSLQHLNCNYHIKVLNEIAFICVADRECKSRTCWAFVDVLVEAYLNASVGSTHERRHGSMLTNSFIKHQIKFFNDSKNEKVAMIYDQVEQLKTLQTRNIDTMLERGEKLSEILNTSESLCETGNCFYKSTVKCLPWYVRFKIWLMGMIGRSQVKKPKRGDLSQQNTLVITNTQDYPLTVDNHNDAQQQNTQQQAPVNGSLEDNEIEIIEHAPSPG